jgi:choline-sulfatase
MTRRKFAILSGLGVSSLLGRYDAFAIEDPPAERPNVLFFAVDDMNDWTSLLKGYAGKVHTPNQERLAKMGVSFANAQTASPVCCPSRTAMMLGKRPSTTGIYGNQQWWRPHMPDAVSMPMHFRQHGYIAAGAGKIFHHTAGFNPPDQWDDFQRLVFKDDPWFRGAKLNYPWSQHIPNPEGYPFCGMPGTPHEGDWGVIPGKDEADYDDSKTADYAVRFLGRKHTKPFFLACGIFRPHLPWYAPKKYFDMYPLDEIKVPEVLDNDLDDVPEEGKQLSRSRRDDFDRVKKHGKWKEAVQAYLASISFADSQLGRVLDALANSEYMRNTVIVFWSDHGWHLGEKNHWHKMTLWEEAARIPFIVAVPGLTKSGTVCTRPVDMTAVFPTLVELCGLEPKKDLDGTSIVPLLKNPAMAWDVPAVTQYKRGQCAVRYERYRYIRYSDGSEELYDHEKDPKEWTNLAGNRAYLAIKKELSKSVPHKWAKGAPSKSAYKFDHREYTWIHRQSRKTAK